jgi:hypothetical protein
VTLSSTGLCTIQATQLGSATWPAAPPVDQSFSVLALVKLYLPGNLPIVHGLPILVAFSLDGVNNRPVPNAIAGTADLAVSFNGGPPIRPAYVPWLQEFGAWVPTASRLAPGSYPLTISSNSPSVPVVPTTVSLKIVGGRNDHRG